MSPCKHSSAAAPFLQPCICSPQIKQTQDEEKKQLTALRDLIKSSLQLDQKEVGRSHPDTPDFKLKQMKILTRPAQTHPHGAKHSNGRPDSLIPAVMLQVLQRYVVDFYHAPPLTLATTRFGACLLQHRASAQCCTMLVASVW